jgi:hypothetical protein
MVQAARSGKQNIIGLIKVANYRLARNCVPPVFRRKSYCPALAANSIMG